MINLCFMTSHGLSLPQELINTELIKKQEIVIPASLEHLEPWKQVSSFSKSSLELDSTMMKPLLMDESLISSFGISEKYARQEKVMEFLLSKSEEFKERGFDMSLLSELMKLEAMNSNASSSILYLNQELEKPVFDNPEFSMQLNDQVLFSSSMLSIASEFNLSKNSTKWRQFSPLIPQFQWLESEVLRPTNLKEVTVLTPLKRLKPTPRKQNTKQKAKKKALYKRNNLYAYESLLSLMISNDHHPHHKQRSFRDLSELLNQVSVSVAGTGLAVLFSVIFSIVSMRVPFCANKFFDTGLGFSLVILSWAVNRLREVIVHVNKKAKNEVIIKSVERSIKEVYLRAVTVIVVFALRFAC